MKLDTLTEMGKKGRVRPGTRAQPRIEALPRRLNAPPPRRAWVTVVTYTLQFALAAAAFRVMGLYRLIDPDEGHFLSAIRSVYHGLSPCQDFFYQQTPILPYPYAAAMRLLGYGYETCMWVSVLCGAGMSVLTAAWFARRGGGAAASWIGWLLVMLNAPILFWTPTVKNHAMPLFFGTLALFAASRREDAKRPAFGWGALAGFAAMCSVGTRLPAMPFALAAGLWVLFRAIMPTRPLAARQSVLGFAVGVLPPALLILRSVFPDPWVFYFDIVGFHKIRSGSAGTFGTWETVTHELRELGKQAQFPALLAVALVAAVWCLTRRPCPRTGDVSSVPPREARGVSAYLAGAGIVAALTALLPYQTFHQYYMVPAVFLLLAGAPMWRAVLNARRRVVGGLVTLLLLAAYGATPINGTLMLFNHMETVFPGFPKEWGHAEARAVAEELARRTTPDDVVFTTWQGYSFMADRREMPGNENFNARTISYMLPDDALRRLHVATNAELAAAIMRGEPKALANGFFIMPFYRDVLTVRNPSTGLGMRRPEIDRLYTIAQQSHGHQLWVRR